MEEGVKIRKVNFLNDKKQKLCGILHEKSKNKIVVLCHGFTANKNCNFIPPLAEYLSENNFSVFRFDFTGNGESEGEFTEGTYSQENSDLKKAMDLLRKLGYEKIALVGHSMGGAVSIIRASSDKRVNCLVSIAGVAYPGNERLSKKQTKPL